MKKVCIVTSTRAEYGLLKNIIKTFISDNKIWCDVVVTGTHLLEEYGNTYLEIEQDRIPISKEIHIMGDGIVTSGVCDIMATAISKFGKYFEEYRPDLLVLLGDRYEIFSIAAAAINYRIPIAHLYGGETTEGAVDEALRHSITKMSYLHFTATEEYRRRVIQLGEAPARVFNVGSIGVENVMNSTLMSRTELSDSLGISLDRNYAVATFHPTTLEDGDVRAQCRSILNACKRFPDIQFIFTGANADTGGQIINEMLVHEVKSTNNIFFVKSLGNLRYLSALKYAKFVLGNSSSGITEAPSFHIPTINIGNRQKGRIQAASIINCNMRKEKIVNSITEALSMDCTNINNPYEKVGTTKNIVKEIKKFLDLESRNIVKSFYDLSVEI